MPGKTNDAYGFGLYGFDEQGVGTYFDIRTTVISRVPTENSSEPTDTFLRTEEDVGGANVGLTYLLSREPAEGHWAVAVFGGIGYAEFITVEKYREPNGDKFWVEEKDGGVNVNLGVAAWYGHAVLILGYDTFLEAPSFGIGYRF